MARPKSIISKSEIAKELGLSKGRISQLIAAGGFPVRPDGKVDRDAATEWYQANVRPRACPYPAPKPPAGSGKPPRTSEFRKSSQVAGDAGHGAVVEALAGVAGPTAVLSFAVACRGMGLTPTQSCAAAQVHAFCVTAELSVDEAESVAEPSESDWRTALGAFDQDEADRLAQLGINGL